MKKRGLVTPSVYPSFWSINFSIYSPLYLEIIGEPYTFFHLDHIATGMRLGITGKYCI